MKPLEIEGTTYNRIKKIGRGEFSIVYLLDNDQVLILTDNDKNPDYSKSALSDLYHWHKSHPEFIHLPKVKHVGEVYYYGWKNAYVSPKYQKLTKTNKLAWDQYTEIQDLYFRFFTFEPEQLFKHVLSNLTGTIQAAMESWYTAISNYEDWRFLRFEVKKDNFMVDDQGNLIILDLFFTRKHWVK